LVVEIENKSIIKPFLGGYKNKKTRKYSFQSTHNKSKFNYLIMIKSLFIAEIEYHNAFTQTGPFAEQLSKLDGVFSRDTQTIELRKKSNVSLIKRKI
jgi:hypothetical protein